MLRTAGVLFVTFQEEIAPSSKTNQGENSYKEKNVFWQTQKRDDRWLLREVQIYKPSIIYLDLRER